MSSACRSQARRMANIGCHSRHVESFLKRHTLELTLAAVVLTRIPFLFAGYGSDPDAWLVASAASTLWHAGTYVESRLPGYPLHEIVSAPAVGVGGSIFSNATTLAAALCCVVVWWTIVRTRAQSPILLLIALAWAPVFWQHSAVTLDYVWSLLFLLLAVLSTLHERLVWTGVMIGVAAGFRLPNLLMLLPMMMFAVAEHMERRKILLCVAVACGVTVLAFLPVLMKYGGVIGWLEHTRREMSDVRFTASSRIASFLYRSVYFFGPLAVGVLLVALARERKRILHDIRGRHALTLTSLAAIGTFLLLFLWIPLERAYLLPILPFVLLLADAFLSRRMLAVFALVLVLHGVVSVDLVKRNGGRKEPGFNIHAGMVIEEFQDRLRLLREREYFSSYPYPSNSVVMTGGGSAFWFENERVVLLDQEGAFGSMQALTASALHRLAAQRRDTSVFFLPHLLYNELAEVRRRGYAVFCTGRAQPFVEHTVGYDMEANGVVVLHLEE